MLSAQHYSMSVFPPKADNSAPGRRLLTHPIQRLDIGFHRLFDLAHHDADAPLSVGAERALRIGLAQGLAELPVRCVDASLPAGGDLCLATEAVIEEGEVLLNESARRR